MNGWPHHVSLSCFPYHRRITHTRKANRTQCHLHTSVLHISPLVWQLSMCGIEAKPTAASQYCNVMYVDYNAWIAGISIGSKCANNTHITCFIYIHMPTGGNRRHMTASRRLYARNLASERIGFHSILFYSTNVFIYKRARIISEYLFKEENA